MKGKGKGEGELEEELKKISLPGIDNIETLAHLEYGDSASFLSRPDTPRSPQEDDGFSDVLSIEDLDSADLPPPSRDALLKAPPVKPGTIDFDHSGNQGLGQRDVREEREGREERKVERLKNQ